MADYITNLVGNYEWRDLMIAVMLLAGVVAIIIYGFHEKTKSGRFPLSPNRDRRDLQAFIDQHAAKNPEASLESLKLYLDQVIKRNTKLTFTVYPDRIVAVLLNQKPVEVTIEDGLYRAKFGVPGQPDGDLYQSPLALVWHICHWNLTFEDETRFYRHVKKQRLYEVRNNLVYFHISVKDYSSFRKIDGVWQYEPRAQTQAAAERVRRTA